MRWCATPRRRAGTPGASLAQAPVTSTGTRQVFDLPRVVLRVVEHQIGHRLCGCGQVRMGAAPAGVGALGPVRARGAGVGHLPVAPARICRWPAAELLSEVVGAPVSEGSLAGWYTAAAAGLDGFDDALKSALGAADVLTGGPEPVPVSTVPWGGSTPPAPRP